MHLLVYNFFHIDLSVFCILGEFLKFIHTVQTKLEFCNCFESCKLNSWIRMYTHFRLLRISPQKVEFFSIWEKMKCCRSLKEGLLNCFVKLHCIINSIVRTFLWCVLVTFYYHQVHNAGGLPFNPSADKSPK